MTSPKSFWLLVLVALLSAAATGLATTALAISGGTAVPSGYVLTWCGQWLGALYGIQGRATIPAVILIGVVAGMIVVGTVTWCMTWWRTRQLVNHLASHRMLLPAATVAFAAEVGLAGQVWLVQSPDAFSLCFGYVRPRVCLSSAFLDVLSEGELKAVLAHERAHVVARDPLKTALAATLAAALLPFPLVAALRRSYIVSREVDADTAALLAAGRPQLAGALHKMLTHPRPLTLRAHHAVGGWSTCTARLDQLLHPEVARLPRPGLGVTAVTLVTLALLVAGGEVLTTVKASAISPLVRGPAAMMCDVVGEHCVVPAGIVPCCLAPAMETAGSTTNDMQTSALQCLPSDSACGQC